MQALPCVSSLPLLLFSDFWLPVWIRILFVLPVSLSLCGPFELKRFKYALVLQSKDDRVTKTKEHYPEPPNHIQTQMLFHVAMEQHLRQARRLQKRLCRSLRLKDGHMHFLLDQQDSFWQVILLQPFYERSVYSSFSLFDWL